VRYGETWLAVKQRIQSRLGVNDRDWEKIKVTVVSQGFTLYLEDDEETVKSEHFYSATEIGKPWLGLDHVNKVPKKSRHSTVEKSIKIYN